MLLYLLQGDSTFNIVRPAQEQLWQAQGGREVMGPWKEIDFDQSEGDESEFVAADCLTMNTCADGPLLSNSARDILARLLCNTGQSLPVRVFGRQYWWHNCTALVEALDVRKTDADWSCVEGNWGSFKWICTVRSLAFRPNRIRRAPPLFRIPEFPQGVLFAQSPLRNAVRDHGLTGFRFEPVWSADLGGVSNPTGIGFNGMFTQASTDDLRRKRQAAREMLLDRE